MNEVIKNMMERRSIKKYLPQQISDAELQDILTAGRYAPTGRDRQPLAFVIVQDAETISVLSAMNAEILGTSADPFYGAPTVVLVLAKADVSTRVEDGSLAIGNMMLAAHSIGVGSCWVHRAREMFASEKGRELLKKWGIEGEWQGVGCCLLGYSDAPQKQASERRSLVVRV